MSTLIIGSGITGMAAALLCAQQGMDCTILEAQTRPASLLRGFTRAGLHFDTGFHCAAGLEQHGILRRWLKSLGVWQYIDTTQLYPLREEFRFGSDACGTENFFFPAGYDALIPAVRTQFGAETATHFADFVQKMLAVLQLSPYTDPSVTTAPKLVLKNIQSFEHVLEGYPFPPTLKQMLRVRCLLYGVRPEEANFNDYSLVSGLYFSANHGLHGGGKAIANAFMTALKAADIPIRCAAHVTRIEHAAQNVTGVELATGEFLPCSRCIFTGHPAQLVNIIGKGPFRPAFYNHIAEMHETSSALLVFGEAQHPRMLHSAIHLLPNSRQQPVLAYLEDSEPMVYVLGGTPQTNRHPFVAIVGTRHTFPHGNPQPRPAEYLAWKQQATEKIRQYIQRRVPEMGTITIHDAATPLSMRHWITGASGSLYGIAHDISTLSLLPATRLQNFFLAGQNILLPGILGGIISAALALGFATGHDNVLREFRQCKDNE